MVIFLFHFAFFLNVFKSRSKKNILQSLFDYIFKQLETSIREIGYGDASINKKMKNYVNVFYSILQNIENWDNLEQHKKIQIFQNFLNIKNECSLLINYFDNYRNYIKKSTFNSLLKGVIKLKF